MLAGERYYKKKTRLVSKKIDVDWEQLSIFSTNNFLFHQRGENVKKIFKEGF